jgi:hypothetical protein
MRNAALSRAGNEKAGRLTAPGPEIAAGRVPVDVWI